MTDTPKADERLAEIRARADAATHPTRFKLEIGIGWVKMHSSASAEADAAFILHNPTDVPYLLDEIDRLSAERDLWRAEWEQITETARVLKAKLDTSRWYAGDEPKLKAENARLRAVVEAAKRLEQSLVGFKERGEPAHAPWRYEHDAQALSDLRTAFDTL